ncbi:MAG: DNA replication and repair protein RecF [Candidatus Rokubacteria bacterium]|nr:DNA replication and repair protein RecF [Candidatus Rokubacteria bacterium]
MQIGGVQLVDFRSYRTLQVDPAARLNLLSGPNAQGKTNLLEALGMLVTGRSFRTARVAEVPRWGAETATLSGELVRAEGGSETRRTVRRSIVRGGDGAWSLGGEGAPPWARAIAFGWQDLEIVNGAPGARRNFIDGSAGRLFPTHLATLVRFRQILARRNRVLQAHRADPALAARLEPWNEQLAAVGMELIDRRRKGVASLQTELARVYASLAETRSKVEIRYRTVLGEAAEPAALLGALERSHREERRRGQTLVGPHRDDLAIEIDGADARTFGSRGQQRLVALALRLAEVLPVTEAVGTPPVLLLDDALSELDPRIRGHVLRELAGAEQVFLTTPEPLAVPGAAVYHVNGGGITAA